MKIRTDFVSNSSSSSFVILGKVIDFRTFVKLIEAAGWKRQEYEDEHEESEDFWNIRDWIREKSHGFIDAECEEHDYERVIGNVVVGANPSKMKDSDTLKDFKLKIADALNNVGIKAGLSDIHFESGGSDASGSSWIGSCG